MTGMDHIEATVCQHDSMTRLSMNGQFDGEFVITANLVGHRLLTTQDLPLHFRQWNRSRAEAGDLESRGDIGEPCRIRPIQTVRSSGGDRGDDHIAGTGDVVDGLGFGRNDAWLQTIRQKKPHRPCRA